MAANKDPFETHGRLAFEAERPSLLSTSAGASTSGTIPVTDDVPPGTLTHTRIGSEEPSVRDDHTDKEDASKATSVPVGPDSDLEQRSVGPPPPVGKRPLATEPAAPKWSERRINVCWDCIEQGQTNIMRICELTIERAEKERSHMALGWLDVCFGANSAVRLTPKGPECEHASRQLAATYKDCYKELLKRDITLPEPDRPQMADGKAESP